MADVNANIGVNIDTTQALAQLKALQRQISQFHTSIAKSSETAALAQRDLQRNFINSINSIGAFSAELRTVKTTAESFTDSLEKNKFSMREYFRYAGGATRTFGKLFKSEFDTIGRVAEDRVKKLQTQYIKLGRDSSGVMRAIAVIPNQLDMNDFSTKTQIAAQKQALFNQLVKQGSTNLLNFGKNTQWAGRQLMVGFTLPLATLGTTAAKTFMEMEAAALKFRKVYGDLLTPQAETQAALKNIQDLGKEFTKYGISVSQTVGLAADAAAAGFQGLDLQRQTTEATRLSVLGQIDNQKALETTISLQNAFKMSSADLAGAIDFLNAVENQTVVSLDDITTAIPKVAPVIKQLGGDVKDLAFFLAAMKEGGVNASEGANALKSGLASLINPTQKASDMLASMGINIKAIIEANKGDLKATVISFAQALDTLDPLTRARAIEQLFGKFQFARLSTLFANVTKQTGQAARVLDLAGTSVEQLASLSQKELGITADSAMNKFKKSVEDMRMALVPVGQTFLQAVTPIVEFIGKILEKFNGLSDGVKKAIVVMTVAIGAIGPVALMTFGLLANGLANIVKGAMILRNGYLRLTGQTQILGEQTDFLTTEQLNAAAVAHSLDQSHARLVQTFNVEREALDQLILAYQGAARAAANFAMNNPGMMMPPGRKLNKGAMNIKKYKGGVVIVPGSGNKDTVPAMLTPGESVIPKDMTEKYAPLIQGMIAGNIPGYMAGVVNVGQQAVGLDFAKGGTAKLAQRLIDEMLKEGSGIENALTIVNEALARMANDTKISIGSFTRELDLVTKEITGSVIPKQVLAGAGRKERRFNAGQTGIGSIETQVKGNVVLEEEVSRAAESSKKAQDAIKKYYEDMGMDLTQTDDKTQKANQVITQAADVHRAHVIEIQDNIDKMFQEAWNPDAWIAQSSTLNQLSNIMEKSPGTLNEYLKNLNEVNADETLVNSIREKITNNIALTEQELAVQKQVLERMLASTASMAKVAPGFAPQAVGAIAATEYLMQNPAQQAGVGSRTVQQQVGARQTLTQARFRGQQSFTPVTQEAQYLVDQVVLETARAAGTQSPSKRTIPIGEDIARGLEVGMNNEAANVAASAKNLVNEAITEMRPSGLVDQKGNPLMVPVNKPGVPIGDIPQSAAVGPNTKSAIIEEVAARKTATQKLYSMNKALMSASFALTAVAGAGSMAGGTLGNLSQQVMKYSGLLFGLMTVTQMLTQESFLLLVARRKQAAVSVVGSMPMFTRNAAGAGMMAGLKNFGKYLLSAGKYVLRFGKVFLGLSNPVGWIVTGLTLTASLIFAANNQRKKEIAAIESLGKAAFIAANELEAIKGATGANLTKTAFEAPTLFGVSAQSQDQIQQFQTAIKDSKELMARVEALRGATAGQAAAVLQSFGIELIARGMDPKTTQDFIKAIADMSGNAGVLATAKIQLDTLDLQKELSGTVTIFDKAFSPALASANKGGKDLEKNLTLVAGVAASSFNVLSSQFSQGKINAEQFNKGVDAIRKNINTLGKTQSLYVLRKALIDLNPQMSLVASNIKNGADAFKLLQMGAMGVNLSGFIAQIQAAGTVTDALRAKMDTVFGLAGRLADLKSQLAAAEAANAAGAAGTGTGGDTGAAAASKEDPRLAYLRKAQAKLTIAAILDVEKPAEQDFKNKVNGIVESINKELKAVDVNLQIDPKSIKNVDDIDVALKRINMDIEKAITPAYRAAQFQVEDLKDSTEKYSHENELINHELDKMEKFYAKQKDALAEVGRLEAYNNAQRKRQITLADALTSGDISAAAQAAQEMQAAQAEFANETQQKALENNPELLALREQIAANDEKIWEINQQIYDIQQKSIDPVDKQIRQYEREKTLLNDINSDYQTAIDYAKAKLRVDGMSAAQIEREISLRQAQLDLAGQGVGGTITAGVAFKPIDTSKLKADIAALQAELNKIIPTDEPITNWFSRQWMKVKEIWGGFKKWWKEHVWDPFSESPVGNWFEDRWNNMKNIWSRFSGWWSDNITTPLKTKWNSAMDTIGQKWNSFKENMGVIVETGAALFRAISELFDQYVIQPLKAKWNQFTAWFGTAVIEPVKTKWNEFSTWVGTNLIQPLKTKWNEFTGWFGTNIIDPIKTKWDALKTWVDTNLIQPIKTKFAEITQPFKDAIEKIGVWWEDWKTKTFDQKVESFKNMFKSIFNPDTWKGWFSNAISMLDSVFKGFVNNTLIDRLNGIRLTIPTSIFGIRVPVIGGQSWGFNIPRLAKGGQIPGYGNSDNYPALLTPGEFVVNKDAAKAFGPLLGAINSGRSLFKNLSLANSQNKLPNLSPSNATFGSFQSASPMRFQQQTYSSPSYNSISPVSNNKTNIVEGSRDLYNYSVNINVKSGSNANEIANSVITQIRQIDSQRIRGNRA